MKALLPFHLLTLALTTFWMSSTAQAESADCKTLQVGYFGDSFMALSYEGIYTATTQNPISCNNTVISSSKGEVVIQGKTYADAIKQANRMQPHLYWYRKPYTRDPIQTIRVVFSTTSVTVNARGYPLTTEAIGYSMDLGETLRPLLLEGKIYSLKFKATDTVVVFTDGYQAKWGEVWLYPKKNAVIFKGSR